MIGNKKIELHCEFNPLWNNIRIWFLAKGDNSIDVSETIVFRGNIPAGIEIDPTMSIQLEEAQQFMDELWRIGLRPSEGTGSAGSLAATQKHLEDMRKLTFQLMENKE